MTAKQARPAPRGQWVMAAALLGILGVAMAPLPAVMFDLLIGVSLCLAALTFLVTLSGVSLGGIGAPFWGVVAGAVALGVQHFRSATPPAR